MSNQRKFLFILAGLMMTSVSLSHASEGCDKLNTSLFENNLKYQTIIESYRREASRVEGLQEKIEELKDRFEFVEKSPLAPAHYKAGRSKQARLLELERYGKMLSLHEKLMDKYFNEADALLIERDEAIAKMTQIGCRLPILN